MFSYFTVIDNVFLLHNALYIFWLLGEPLRRGVLALRAALACSRRAIRSITFALAASRLVLRWFRYYPSRLRCFAARIGSLRSPLVSGMLVSGMLVSGIRYLLPEPTIMSRLKWLYFL
jgi:hypothetical protein